MIDIGANLTDRSFKEDLDQVIQSAQANGVQKIIVTGTTVELSKQANHLREEYPEVLSHTVGMHPHHADDFTTQSLTPLSDLVGTKPVAIGETGLDYYRNFSKRDNQRRSFQAQIELAAQHELPLFVHDRDSEGEVLELLQRYAKTPVVIHCFTGNEHFLHAYLEMGYYIGLTGWICDERRGGEVAALVPQIPLDRLLIETDSPYLLPRNISPKPKTRRNEPMYLKWVTAKIAKLINQEVELIQNQTTANAIRFFNLTNGDSGHRQNFQH